MRNWNKYITENWTLTVYTVYKLQNEDVKKYI